MLVVLLLRDSASYLTWPHHSDAIGLSPGFSGIFYFIGTGIVSSFILPVRYSEHWKASWMLRLAPLSVPDDLWRGVQITTLLYIIAPCMLLMFGIATIIWGVLGILHVLPCLTVLLYYVILFPKPASGLPLAREFVQSQIAGAGLIPFLLSLFVIVAFTGIQLLTFWLNLWLYYGFYCVTVVGGLIGFIYHFRKNV